MTAKTGCVPEFTSDPNLGRTGKEWDVGRHRGYRGGVVSGACRAEVEVHDGEGLGL